jgi:hypothetical protein
MGGKTARGHRMARFEPQYKRKRAPGKQRMHVEEFADKTARNARFQELRAGGTPHVSKFSTVRENKSVWCVVRTK